MRGGQVLTCLLLLCVSLAACQNLTLPAGSKTHYVIGGLAIRTVEILMNSYKPTFETYLNRVVGPRFNPPINFTFIALDFTTTYTKVADGSIDFIYTNPAIYGCLEWEYGLSSLVTQTNSRQGNELAEFGGVIFTKADRDDIQTIADLKDKKIAAASISGLGSGQAQWLVMQKIGMSLMQDPSQVVFTGGKGGQEEVVKLVAEGLIDVGFVRTDQIERMESSGATLYDGQPTKKSMFKYINKKTRYSNGAVFPFEGSTDLYPEWNLAATKSVPVTLAQQVQEALYDINSTSTEATSGNYVKWQQTLSYTPLIDMVQRLGVMVDDGSGNSRCQTASELYDLVVCPAGSFKKSKSEFDTGCPDTGLSCAYKAMDFTGNCICKPCVYADEGVSGQLTGVTGGLGSDACVNETRTLEDILSGVRDGSSGFFQGGLGGMAQGNWRTYGCWRKHACLGALNAAGIDTTGDAICYKFNSAQHSWLLWGLQSSLNLQCSSDRAPGVGGDDAEDEHGVLWGFPLTAPRVKYVSNYSFPLAELNRTLTPIAGYDAGVYNFTTIAISDKGWGKYWGGVFGPDGKIVFVPCFAHNIGVYDPSSGSFSTIDIANKISIDSKYRGGVLGPDGKIVFVPCVADNIGVYDPLTRSFSTIDIANKISGEEKYNGGVLGPDGKIVFVPWNADNIGVYDPSTSSFSTIDIANKISTYGKYEGGVLGPDGKIVFLPRDADSIGVYDPSTGSFSTIDIANKISGDAKFVGGVLGPDGKIVFVPWRADYFGVYDPSTSSFSTIDIRSKTTGDLKYAGGVLGPDGKIVFVSYNADNIGVYDPSTGSFSTIDIADKISTDGKYLGGVLGPDGKIVFVPCGAGNIGVLELGNQDLAYEVSGVNPKAWSALLSPHFNKL